MIKTLSFCSLSLLLFFCVSCKSHVIEGDAHLSESDPKAAYSSGYSLGYKWALEGYGGGTPRVPREYLDNVSNWKTGYLEGQKAGNAKAQKNEL